MASATLEVLIKANDQATQALQNMNKQFGSLTTAARQAGIAMTALGASIVAMAAMSIKTYVELGDEVQKMSLRTGWAAESLSELRYVAQISGTELSAFEKSTRRMSGAILDATEGLETYQRAFRQLGVDADALLEMEPEQAFWVIAEALAEMDNEIERSAIAMDIFGRTGTNLFPMFAEGAEGIQELREEAHELGIVFDQEAANAAAHLKDNMLRFTDSIDGLKIAVAEALAPALDSMITSITSVVKWIREWSDEHPGLSRLIAETGIVAGVLLVGLGGFLIVLPSLIKLTAAWGVSLLSLTGIIAGLILGFSLIAAGIHGLVSNAQTRQEQLEKEQRAEELSIQLKEEYAKANEGLENSYVELLKQAKEEGFVIGEAQEQYLLAVQAAEDYNETLDEQIDTQEQLNDVLRKSADQLAVLQSAYLDYVRAHGGAIAGEQALEWAEVFEQQQRYKRMRAAAAEAGIVVQAGTTMTGLGRMLTQAGITGYAQGGVIDEPTLLYGLSSRRVYAKAGEAGTEYVTPATRQRDLHFALKLDEGVLTRFIIREIGDEVFLLGGM